MQDWFCADGATGVATNTTISVTFDRAMDALTITGSSDTSCTGTVQVSTGTFVNGTCVPIFSATATNSNQTFTFTPSPALANKEEIIAVNKLDLATDDSALEKLTGDLPEKEIFPISAATRQNVEPLLETAWTILRRVKEEEAARKPTVA